jgi:hypothetical protein
VVTWHKTYRRRVKVRGKYMQFWSRHSTWVRERMNTARMDSNRLSEPALTYIAQYPSVDTKNKLKTQNERERERDGQRYHKTSLNYSWWEVTHGGEAVVRQTYRGNYDHFFLTWFRIEISYYIDAAAALLQTSSVLWILDWVGRRSGMDAMAIINYLSLLRVEFQPSSP